MQTSARRKMYMIEVIGKESYTGQLEHLFPLNVPNVNDKPEASHPFVQTSLYHLLILVTKINA